jgi:enoyl-CoA hydratase/carnithine racemase
MPYQYLTVSSEGPLGVITLNRPERRNPLSLGLMLELIGCLDEFATSKHVRAIILAAAGKVFSAGHDLSEMQGRTVADYRHLFDVCTELMAKIQSVPQPVIAQVQGIATAAGCQLVATCDLAIASDQAAFATPGVKIGLFCTTPMVALSRAVGRKRAMEMLLTGKLIDAATAAEWGLVNRVVPAAELESATRTSLQNRRGQQFYGRAGQAGLLHADRSRSAQSLRLRQGSDDHELARGGRAGGHFRVS